MRLRGRERRLFYGWVVAIALALMASINNSGSFSFGMFLMPMSGEFGLDRATLALAPTLNRWLAGLLLPLGGYLGDRLGPRRLLITGGTTFGLSMLLLALAASPPIIFITYGLLGGISMAMTGGGNGARVVNSWFRRERGTAQALAGGGVIIGQVVIIPIITAVMLRWNWHVAALVFAAIVLVIIVPVGGLLIRNTPADKGLFADNDASAAAVSAGAARDRAGASVRQAIRQPVFWQLSFGLIACGVTMSFPNNHLQAYTMDLGMSPMAASEAIGLAGLLSLPGSLALGYLGDRSSRQRMLAIAYGLRAVTYILLLEAHDPNLLLAAGLVLGLSWGATVPLTAAIVADVFGQRNVATIVSLMTSMMFLASGTFTYLAGLDYVRLGSYDLALVFAFGMGLLACVVCWLIRTRPYPTEVPEIGAAIAIPGIVS